MRVLAVVLVASCSFTPGQLNGAGGDDAGATGSDGSLIDPDAAGSAASDTMGDCWSYTPTNFDPCTLAAPATAQMISSPTTINLATTSLPKTTVTQSDSTTVTVLHLAALTVNASLTISGSTPVILAVDGDVIINSTIVVTAGRDDAAFCTGLFGIAGQASGNNSSGGGGGGGGAGAGDGANGGNGNASQSGTGGGKGNKLDNVTALSPLRGGCRGGAGGGNNSVSGPAGGAGGGGLQIAAQGNLTINSSGKVDAGGEGGAQAGIREGGGGGGGGGIVFLEANKITINAAGTVCADGGSGAEGGGGLQGGAGGNHSPCTGIARATTLKVTTYGGSGGSGGYVSSVTGAQGTNATGDGAGGGGAGGGVGWIRVRSVTPATISGTAIITPAARLN